MGYVENMVSRIETGEKDKIANIEHTIEANQLGEIQNFKLLQIKLGALENKISDVKIDIGGDIKSLMQRMEDIEIAQSQTGQKKAKNEIDLVKRMETNFRIMSNSVD